MTDTSPSGVDLARAALAAARAAAKTRPAQPQKKPREKHVTRTGRDPVGLGAAISGMMTERGWEPQQAGGNILDQWPAIAPELVGKVTAESFDHETGTLHLRPVSDAYATQLRLFRPQIIRRIREKTGHAVVRDVRVLSIGAQAAATPADVEQPTGQQPRATMPVHTRENASPGYHQALASALANKPQHATLAPQVKKAIRQQNEALLRNREPENAFSEAAAALEAITAGQSVDSLQASIRAALDHKHGVGQPVRRAFDAA
ncbi:DUF721 domain-containing protein [Streptomyces sp. NPDC047985]|uniref:DUF721 domain-containing protein n=1 Tax=Streptomyces sp. NPDC047985 TaxID=3155384 RepID=UPI00342E4C71